MTFRIPIASIDIGGSSVPRLNGSIAPAQFQDARPAQMQQLGAALQQTGLTTLSIASMLKSERDVARSKEAFNQWSDHSMELLKRGDDAYFQKIGKAASGYERARVLQRMEQKRDELLKGLENEVQRGRFRQTFDQSFRSIREKVFGYEAEQLRNYNESQNDVMSDTLADQAADAWVDGDVPPEIVSGAEINAIDEAIGEQEPASLRGRTYAEAVALAEQERQERQESSFQLLWKSALNSAREKADLRDLPKDAPERAQIMQNQTTRIHARIVNRLIDEDRADEAAEYVRGIKPNELTGDAKVALGRVTKRATLNDRSLRLSEDILKHLAGTIETRDLPFDADITAWDEELKRDIENGRLPLLSEPQVNTMLRRADEELFRRFSLPSGHPKKISAEMRNLTMQFLKEDHARRKTEFHATASQTLERADQWIQDNQATVDSPAFPATLLDKLQTNGLLGAARKLGDGRPRVTDPSSYKKLLDLDQEGGMIGMSRPELFNQFYSDLAPREWNEALAMHANANDLDDGPRIDDDDIFTVSDRLLKVAFDNGVVTGRTNAGKPTADGVEEVDRFLLFKQEVQRRFQAARRDGGKLSADGKSALMAEVALDKVFVQTDSPFFGIDYLEADPEVFAFELTDETSPNAYVQVLGQDVQLGKIPPEITEAIVEDLREFGLPARKTDIARYWLTHYKDK